MNKVTVKIHGQDYTISGEKDEAEIKEIADRVDNEMHRISASMPFASRTDVAILAALSLAEAAKDGEIRAERKQEEKVVQVYEETQGKIKSYEEKLKELQNKVNEYENNFFDLQMENVRLKDEIEKLKGNL